MIVAIDGKAIKTMDELVENVEARAVGETIEMTLLRDDKRRTVKVYLSERPSGQ
jgi:S1-C subfamily serine protease